MDTLGPLPQGHVLQAVRIAEGGQPKLGGAAGGKHHQTPKS